MTELAVIFKLALRLARREWRAGEVRVLAAAVFIAVTSVSGIGLFTQRMSRGLDSGATELLAADLVLVSPTPIGESIASAAGARGLRVARTASFRSVVLAGERLQLTEVKAVSKAYPLRGRLRVADRPFAPDSETRNLPAAGEVWADPRLFALLDLATGDRIHLGSLQPVLRKVLAYEPDRAGDLFSIAPRLMMAYTDLDATGLISTGSRIKYRMLFAGQSASIAAWRSWLQAHLQPGQDIQGVRDARPEIRNALQRAGQFLNLAALVCALLAAAAIALCANRYSQRHLDSAALIRCLGLNQRGLLLLHAGKLAAIGLLASAAGAVAGLLVQSVLSLLLKNLFLAELPAANAWPLLQGVGIGMGVLLLFALPPLLVLGRVPPGRVLRAEAGSPDQRHRLANLLAFACVAGLVYWQARDPLLATYVLAGGALTVLVLMLAAWLGIRALGRLRSRVGVAWRFGLANITRHSGASIMQIVALGLGLSMLLLLILIRNDLLRQWRDSLPADAPNYFLINIQANQIDPVKELLAGQGLRTSEVKPMIRSRLLQINGQDVTPQRYPNPRARHRMSHGFNLSIAPTLQTDNRIVAGHFWPASGSSRPEVSVERDIAKAFKLAIGDQLKFRIAATGGTVTATLSSLRSVEWDSFHVNFFVVASPGFLEATPASYVSSFYLPAAGRAVLIDLVRQFPNVTVIDVDALVGKVREIMNRAIAGMEYVFALTLLAGLVVLFAALQSTLPERRYESALLRTLGASRARLLQGLVAEFAVLGAVAGLLATATAAGLGALLADRLLSLAYHPDPLLWLAAILAASTGIALAGLAGTWQVIRQPPYGHLRAGS